MRDAPLGLVPTSLDLSRDSRHVSVTFGASTTGPWGGWGGAFVANTGWPGMGTPVGFYDAADPEGLRAALNQARRV